MNLSLGRDSSFVFSFAVLKDLKIEKTILGIQGNVVLVPAVYKSSKFGSFSRKPGGFVLNAKDGAIFVDPASDFSTLTLKFVDESHRNWSCILVPKE